MSENVTLQQAVNVEKEISIFDIPYKIKDLLIQVLCYEV